MKRKFYTLDVFTGQPLAGNPLAVVLECEGLDSRKMQSIAREFNLSETVFVTAIDDSGSRITIRIFTPVMELPFAGHPTIGSAILLHKIKHLKEENNLILEENIGPVRCEVSSIGDACSARFELPETSVRVACSLDRGKVATALGLKPEELDFSKSGVWSAGVEYAMVPVSAKEVLGKIVVNAEAIAQAFITNDLKTSNPYVFCRGEGMGKADFHARMFSPNFGISEDPATGSAVAAMSGWIAKYEMAASEKRTFVIEQGYEMGRPSQILLDIEKRDGSIVNAGISGSAVIVSEGFLKS